MRFPLALLLAPSLLAAPLAAAQTAPAPEGSNWQHVQALPAGQTVHIKARTESLTCKFKAADADSITCTNSKDRTLQRVDIRVIQIPHRGRSTAIGAGIGAGVGLAVGAGLGSTFWTTKSKGAGVGAAIFAPIGLAIGAATDFTRSTVYRAP